VTKVGRPHDGRTGEPLCCQCEYANYALTGLPFSRWISKIDDKRHIPVNATILSSVVSCLLALIYIGSMADIRLLISAVHEH